MIPRTYIIFCSSVFSILASIVVLICLNKTAHKVKSSKLSFWLDMNYPKLFIVYIFLVITFASIRNTPLWTKEEIENVLSIQWTIFGLSLTILLVWNVVIDLLRKDQPKELDATDSIQQYKYIEHKILFSQSIEMTFSSVVVLTANLFFLIISTAFIYIFKKPAELITQNIVMCSFYFTTNAITMLFADMLRPLRKDKAQLIKENTVTKEDFDHARVAAVAQSMFETVFDSDKLTDEEKKQIIAHLVETAEKEDSKIDASKSER